MKYLATLFIALVAGCSNQDPHAVSAPAPAPAIETTTNVLAEPLPGRKVMISVTANDESFYIANCNQHIVVTLHAVGSPDISWGGESDACLSPSIIIPAKATLRFVISPNDGSPELDTSLSYTAHVRGARRQSSNTPSASVPTESMTSNPFKLIP